MKTETNQYCNTVFRLKFLLSQWDILVLLDLEVLISEIIYVQNFFVFLEFSSKSGILIHDWIDFNWRSVTTRSVSTYQFLGIHSFFLTFEQFFSLST